MVQPYASYRETPLWRAIAATLTELQATGEIKLNTAPDYVVGYLCRELEAKGVLAAAALAPEE